jgi:Fic family protein
MYLYEQPNWPKFVWQEDVVNGYLQRVRFRQGKLVGMISGFGIATQSEALLSTLTEDVFKTSDIEGEILNKAQVRSSIARRLNMDIAGLVPSDRLVEGVVEMTLDATQNYASPLTQERLFGWHASLFPEGFSGLVRISVGAWRTDANGPMQVVSGAIGKEKIHFQAPLARRLPFEMALFFKWIESQNDVDPVIMAAISHLYFITIHPFEDGNGRIARAIADSMLARSEESPNRFFSMSSQIRAERDQYYDVLERTQKGGLDVTEWLSWFLECLGRAIENAEVTLAKVIKKAKVWNSLQKTSLSPRQTTMINRLLDDFEGKLTTSKWAKICKCSQDTATRDIEDLMRRGILARSSAGGRSTSYELILN